MKWSEWYPLFRCCFFSNATVSSKYARPNSATFYFPSQNGKNFVTDLLAIRAELYKFEMVTKTDQQDRGRVKWLSKTKKYRISFALLNRLDSVQPTRVGEWTPTWIRSRRGMRSFEHDQNWSHLDTRDKTARRGPIPLQNHPIHHG